MYKCHSSCLPSPPSEEQYHCSSFTRPAPLQSAQGPSQKYSDLDENGAFSDPMKCRWTEFPIETECFSKQGFPVVHSIRHSPS